MQTTLLDFVSYRKAFVLDGHLIYGPTAELKQRGIFKQWDFEEGQMFIWGGTELRTMIPFTTEVVAKGDEASAGILPPPPRSRFSKYAVLPRSTTVGKYFPGLQESMLMINDRLVFRTYGEESSVLPFDSPELGIEGYLIQYINEDPTSKQDGDRNDDIVGMRQVVERVGPHRIEILS